MEILVARNRFKPTRTVGQLYIDGTFFCFTLEDAVREEKIQDETAIPEGRFQLVLRDSPKFGVDCPTLLRVPNYTNIRIHSGNTEEHTEGCLILGYRLNDNGTIKYGTTRPAVKDFKVQIKKALKKGQKIYLTIKNVK